MKKFFLDGVALPPCMIGTWAWGKGANGSEIVFGKSYDKTVLQETFTKAVENGFTFWDTAEIYGMGNSEKLLGEFAKEIDNICISTKYFPKKKYKEGLMEKSLCASMERLGKAVPDIYWLHSSRNFTENVREIATLKKAGKIKSIGVSNFTLPELKATYDILKRVGLKLDSVQNHFSLLSMTKQQKNIIEWCNKNDVIYFAYMVLEQGALTGHYDEKNHFPLFSMRNFTFGKDKFKRIAPLLNYMKDLAENYRVDTSQIPILWAIGKGVVPIIGLTKPEHALSLGESVKKEIKMSEIDTLDKIASNTGVIIKCGWEP